MATHPLSTTAQRPGGANTTMALRVRVLLSRSFLDRRLARGEDPSTDVALTLRARQLRAHAAREEVAVGLDHVLALAAAPPRGHPSSAVPIRGAAVRAERAAIEDLIARLRDGRPAAARGVALARELLVDGSGPLFCGADDGAVGRAARRALAHL